MNKYTANYPATLDKLRRLITNRPMTAAEIARAMKCSLPVVPRRVDDLERRQKVLVCRGTRHFNRVSGMKVAMTFEVVE